MNMVMIQEGKNTRKIAVITEAIKAIFEVIGGTLYFLKNEPASQKPRDYTLYTPCCRASFFDRLPEAVKWHIPTTFHQIAKGIPDVVD